MIWRKFPVFLGCCGLLASIPGSGFGEDPDFDVAYGQVEAEGTRPGFRFEGSMAGIGISHSSAWYSCCLEFVPQVAREGNVLQVIETDQGPSCLCPPVPWDLQMELTGLPPGAYDVFLMIDGGGLLATAAVTIPETETRLFVRGQINADQEIDLSDCIGLLDHLFLDGKGPPCLDAADVNDDGNWDTSDVVYLLSYLFLGGPEPKEPFPEPGEDPSPDKILCSLENSVTATDFIRNGDSDGNGVNELTDCILFLNNYFIGHAEIRCEDAFDGNDDGQLDLDDFSIFCSLWPWLLEGIETGPTPAPATAPVPGSAACGPDPTPDTLGCNFANCEF